MGDEFMYTKVMVVDAQRLVREGISRILESEMDIQVVATAVDGREAIDVAFQDAQSKLRRIALEIVTEVAGEKRLDLVLVKDSALIFRPTLNISDEVLQRLDERTKNARLEVTIDPPKPASQE